MEKETKHTPEHVELPFQADYDDTDKQWKIYTLTGNLVCVMARRAKLIIESGEIVDQELIYRDLILSAPSLQTELSEMKENYEGMTRHCKYLTEINVFNMAFDKADEHWRKSHKVEDGENFIDWYMRYHAAEREADRKQLSEMKKQLESKPFLGWTTDKDVLNQQREYWGAMNGLSEMKKEREELLESYSRFLEDHGYLDDDWRTEHNYPITEFLSRIKN